MVQAKEILVTLIIIALVQISVFGYSIRHKHKHADDDSSHEHIHTYLIEQEFTQYLDHHDKGNRISSEWRHAHAASNPSDQNADIPSKGSDQNASTDGHQHSYNHLQFCSHFEIQSFVYIKNLYGSSHENIQIREILYSLETIDTLYRPPKMLS